MKKISLVFLSVFLLTSCGTSSTSTSTTSFTGTGFTIDVPSTWIAVDKAALPTVSKGSIVLALTSSDIASGFANNMTILKDQLFEKISSKKYSIVNYALTTGGYKEFVKLSEATITFGDKDESNLYTFEAKYSDQTPKQRFLQTAKVCNDQVYLITIGLALSTTDTTKYQDLIKTFTCK